MTFEMKYEVGINWGESGVRALPAEGTASVRALRREEAGLLSVPNGGSIDNGGAGRDAVGRWGLHLE